MSDQSVAPATRRFPEQLRLSIVRNTLAQAIYYSRAEGYGLQVRHWDATSFEEKEHWRDVALTLLESVKPEEKPRGPYFQLAVDLMRAQAEIVTGLRPTHGVVVGAITPKGAA